jgi:hypothetical protein
VPETSDVGRCWAMFDADALCACICNLDIRVIAIGDKKRQTVGEKVTP